MIDMEKLRNKWRMIDEDTRRAMKTGEEFYRWTVTLDMPSDVFELLAELERLKVRNRYLEDELKNCGYNDTDLDNDFLWTFQDEQTMEESK